MPPKLVAFDPFSQDAAPDAPATSGGTVVNFNPFGNDAAPPSAEEVNAQYLDTLRSTAKETGAPADMAASLQAENQAAASQKAAARPYPGLEQGMGDPVYGVGQLALHALPEALRPNALPTAAQFDTTVQNREKDYQAGRTARGETGLDVGRLGGNLLTTAPLMAALPGSAPESLMGAMGQGAATGAGQAAIMPSTSNNYWTDKVGQTAMGAGAGAVVSGLTYGASKALFPAGTDEKAQTVLHRALARDGYDSTQDAQAKLQELGPNATVADLGPNLRGLAEAASLRPGDAVTTAQELTNRNYGMAEDIKKAALEATGAAHKDELIAKRAVQTAPLYEQAFAPQTGSVTTKSFQIKDPTIEEIFAQPESQDALKEGLASIRRDNVIARAKDPSVPPYSAMDFALQRNPDTGQMEKVGTPNLRLIDALKRGYDEILNSGSPSVMNPKTGTPTNYARQISIFRDELINRADQQNHDHPYSKQGSDPLQPDR